MKKQHLAAIIFLLFPIFMISQEKAVPKQALLIIDVQEFYFPEGFNPLVEPEKASEQAAKLLDVFRTNNKTIVHIKHETNKDSLIHNNVLPLEGEKVIKKRHINSFRDTDLLAYLKQNKVNQVVICGMMTHMCVEAAARTASDFGFGVIVIEDACATRDIIYQNDTVKAADVHASTLGTINSYYGIVTSTNEFLGQ